MSRPASGRGGFTLAEAMVALTISSILVVLVSTVFLVQNRYYAVQTQRTSAQDLARSVTELLSGAIRTTASGGITVARADSLVVRTPMVIGGVCATSGNFAFVHLEGGEEALDTDEIAGVAVLDDTTGVWSFYNERWSGRLDGGLPRGAENCGANGADTAGVRNDFLRIGRLSALHGSVPPPGTMIMLFRETTFAFGPSRLDTAGIGLYRGSWRDTLVEYATGLDSTAGFQYRRGGQSVYEDEVSGSGLATIDAVRIQADARLRARAGGTDDLTFGWSVNVPIRNVR